MRGTHGEDDNRGADPFPCLNAGAYETEQRKRREILGSTDSELCLHCDDSVCYLPVFLPELQM